MKLTVCPFSVVVFVGTSLWYIQQLKKKQQHQDNNKSIIMIDNKTNNNISIDVIFVLGGPGVGKGTQCQLVEARLSIYNVLYKHLSAGDLLRAERSNVNSTHGKQINDCISAGILVPSIITCQLIQNAMNEYIQTIIKDESTSIHITFLIDGFPRSADNAKVWNDSNIGKTLLIRNVLNFICPQEITMGRLIYRGQSTGRADDLNINIIRNRIQTFDIETKPVIEYYKNETLIPVYNISTDQSVEHVYQSILQYL